MKIASAEPMSRTEKQGGRVSFIETLLLSAIDPRRKATVGYIVERARSFKATYHNASK